MKHNDDGNFAEEEVARYLAARGYEIIERNWKVKRCEIDIVAKKDSTIHFVEVKYRSSTSQGGGFEYITKSKLRQMAFAAEMWVAQHKWSGGYCLSGAEVSGTDFSINFIENIF